jgi:hypothetical protein
VRKRLLAGLVLQGGLAVLRIYKSFNMSFSNLPAAKEQIQIPPQLLVLAETLAPVAEDVRRAINSESQSAGHRFVILDDLSLHMRNVEHFLCNLQPRIEAMMSGVICAEHADSIQIGRIVGRFEQVVFELIDGYFLAKAASVDTKTAMAKNLMLGVYRHHINTISSWIDEVVRTFSDPLQAIVEARTRIDSGAKKLDLIVVLNMTAPPEMSKLCSLVMDLQREADAEMNQDGVGADLTKKVNPGLFSTVGAFTFGVAVADVILGRRRE